MKPNLALFDFDGTVTYDDSFLPFLRFSTPRAKWAMGSLLLAPVVLGYKGRIISADVTRRVATRVALGGMHQRRLGALGRVFARDVLPTMIREEMLSRLDWHRVRGDHIVVVSAGLDVYLKPWCEALGLELLCTTLAFSRARFVGRYAGKECNGDEKARRVLGHVRVSEYGKIYAYGDSVGDVPMLRLAHEAYFRGQRVGDWKSFSTKRASVLEKRTAPRRQN